MSATVEDYEHVLADHRRLVRLLDVAMHGEDLAAPQASLCDLIGPAGDMAAEIERLRRLLSVNGATCEDCGAEAYDLDGSEWAKCKTHLKKAD